MTVMTNEYGGSIITGPSPLQLVVTYSIPARPLYIQIPIATHFYVSPPLLPRFHRMARPPRNCPTTHDDNHHPTSTHNNSFPQQTGLENRQAPNKVEIPATIGKYIEAAAVIKGTSDGWVSVFYITRHKIGVYWCLAMSCGWLRLDRRPSRRDRGFVGRTGCRSCAWGVVTGRAGALGWVQVRYPDRQGFSDRTEESNQRPRGPRVRHHGAAVEGHPTLWRTAALRGQATG